jgi:hypothetical protein
MISKVREWWQGRRYPDRPGFFVTGDGFQAKRGYQVYFNYAGVMASAVVRDIAPHPGGDGFVVKLEKIDWGSKVSYWSELDAPGWALFLLWYRVPDPPASAS